MNCFWEELNYDTIEHTEGREDINGPFAGSRGHNFRGETSDNMYRDKE